ncbi:hypothetical protein ATANTOWER_020766, partial [Ataeniobius toweri]|nr:hypothetical protein [Ataeniobius toweri]
SSGEELKYPTSPTLQRLSVNLQWLPPVPSFLSSLRMQKIQTRSLQENFTDYLLSWLHWLSSPLSLPLNEPGSPSTVLPSKIIHLVPPPPQVQVKQDYLDLSLTRHAPRVFNHLTSPPPWRIS